MPVMSALERAFCRSGPWRSFTRRAVLPWVLAGVELDGEVLEVGSGSGSMGEELLARLPSIRLTATDVDPAMLDTARQRLGSFAGRVEVRQADATKLPFPDGCFDAVVSFIMLHHTIQWEEALGEAARVLRPGGLLVGYDLVKSGPARTFHRLDRSHHRLATQHELSARLGELPLDDVRVEPALHDLVVRFKGRLSDDTNAGGIPAPRGEDTMTTATHRVTGMTCEHCVRAVTEEVSKLAGVTNVKVDLASGSLTVSSDTPVDAGALRAAVDEAGYQIVA